MAATEEHATYIEEDDYFISPRPLARQSRRYTITAFIEGADTVHEPDADIQGRRREPKKKVGVALGADAEFPETCVVCFETVSYSSGRCSALTCQHIFHSECISQWLSMKDTCPTCRNKEDAERKDAERNSGVGSSRRRTPIAEDLLLLGDVTLIMLSRGTSSSPLFSLSIPPNPTPEA